MVLGARVAPRPARNTVISDGLAEPGNLFWSKVWGTMSIHTANTPVDQGC